MTMAIHHNLAKPIALFLTILLFLGISLKSVASDKDVMEPFQGFTGNSVLTIDYSDISSLLDIAVYDVGRSTREKAKSLRASIGTRIKSTRNVYTALESNRFHFKAFKEPENMEMLVKIIASLQSLPNEVPLKMFSRHEQLAYWLNLYNIALIKELVDIYPRSSIGNYLYEEDGLLDKKILKVSGIDLSLNDIQYKILYPKLSNHPVIMYGLYQGYIGSPNIRTKSYSGKGVYAQLDSNAEEFINSNRGLFRGTKGRMRVSTLYRRNEQLFPDFDKDLRKHLLEYVDGEYEEYVKSAKAFRANIKDMHFGDIRAGTHSYGGSSAVNTAAMLDSAGYNNQNGGDSGVAAINPGYISEYMHSETVSLGIYDVDTVEILAKLKQNSRVRNGNVTITEERASKKDKGQQENN